MYKLIDCHTMKELKRSSNFEKLRREAKEKNEAEKQYRYAIAVLSVVSTPGEVERAD